MTARTLYGRPLTPKGEIDTVTILSGFIFLLMVLPARYVVGALGAAGTPAGIMGVLCLFWYLSAMLTPKTTPIRGAQPLRPIILLFFCSIMASYAVAMGQSLPGDELNGADRGVLLALGWVGVALLAADGIPRLERLEAVRRRLVAGGTFIAGLGALQFFTSLDLATYLAFPGLTTSTGYTSLLQRDGFNRPSATTTHPIEFGVVLAMLLPLALHGAIHAEPGRKGRRWGQVALILLVLPMTVSRSAILGLVVVAAVILPVWPATWRVASAGVMGCAMVILHAVVPGLLGTITGLWTSIASDSSTTSRTDAYSAVGQALGERPLFGRGFATYFPRTYRFLDNQYMGSLIETGLVGTFALLAVLLAGWFLARRARKASSDPALRHLAQCFAASCAVAIISFATFDALSFPMAANMTFLIGGCCGALWRLIRAEATALPTAVDRA